MTKEWSRVWFVNAGRRVLEKRGSVETLMTDRRREVQGVLHVVKRAPRNLLGLPELEALQLVERVETTKVEENFPRFYRPVGQHYRRSLESS